MTNEELAQGIKEGDTSLLGPLWERNLGLIYRLSRRYAPNPRERGTVIDWDDIGQAGFLALLDAVNAYDPASGNRFTSYLRFSVLRQMGFLFGWRRKPPFVSSLDEPIAGEDEELTLEGIIPDPQAAQAFEDAEEGIYLGELREAISGALGRLPEREAEIVRRRQLGGETLETAAAAIGVTRERVRQIEAKALGKLRRDRAFRQFCQEYIEDKATQGTGRGSWEHGGSAPERITEQLEEEYHRRNRGG